MTRLAIISLVALAACHEPTGRVTLGGGSYTPGPNIITGTDGPDTLIGGPGNDLISGGAGDDVICGDPCGALIEELKRRGL